MEEAPGVRNHSTGEIPEVGRRGGGYVVGNAWVGLVGSERGQFFCREVSWRIGYGWSSHTSDFLCANAGFGGS